MSRLGLSSILISWSAFGGVAGRAGAGADCPKLNGLLVSVALLPALACPKLNGLAVAVGGAGEGVPKANGFFSAGAGEADANEKGGRTTAGFSSAGAVPGRGPNGNPAAKLVSCFPKKGLGASITGAGTGAGVVEGVGPPNEKALFDGSVIAGVGARSPKENPGFDGSAAGAETAGVPKPNGVADGVAPKSDGGLLACCSAGFGASLAGAISAGAVEALNKNGEEDGAGVEAYVGGGEMTGEATGATSITADTFGGARTSSDVPVLAEEGPKTEVLAEAGAAPKIRVAAGAADGVTDTGRAVTGVPNKEVEASVTFGASGTCVGARTGGGAPKDPE